MAAAGTVAVLGSLLAGRLILPGHGFTAARGYPALSLAEGPTTARDHRVTVHCYLETLIRPAQPRLLRMRDA